MNARCKHCNGDDLEHTESNPPGLTRVECMECEAVEIVDNDGASLGTTSPALRRHVNAIIEDAERDI